MERLNEQAKANGEKAAEIGVEAGRECMSRMS